MSPTEIAVIAIIMSVLSLAGQVANLVLKLSIDSRISKLETSLKDYTAEHYRAIPTCNAIHGRLAARG